MRDLFLIEMNKEIESVIARINIFHNVLTDGREYDYDKGSSMALEIKELCQKIEGINDFLDNRFRRKNRHLKFLGLGAIGNFFILLFTMNPIALFTYIILLITIYKGYKYKESYFKQTLYLENKTEVAAKRITNIADLLVNKETKKIITEVTALPKESADDILDEEIELADYLISLFLDSEAIIEVPIPHEIQEIMIVMLQDTLNSEEEDLKELLQIAKEHKNLWTSRLERAKS